MRPFQLLLLPLAIGQTAASTTQNAEAAAKTLLDWYDKSTGIFNTTGWWESANALTTLTNLALQDSSVKTQVVDTLVNSWSAAQAYNKAMSQTKTLAKNGLPETRVQRPPRRLMLRDPTPPATSPTGFLNGFYDDEGWWALAWINAYDLTGNATYLSTAQSIFDDMSKAWTTPCGGGIWWDRAKTSVNAIANELFLSVAAHLANRVTPSEKAYYVDWAQREWDWFQHTGMINAQNNINDGLTLSTCKNNNGNVWSYNQGVILGGLVELNRAAANSTLLPAAQNIALAAIKKLTDSAGVLHDTCEPNCGGDGTQFKGIFMRNLQALQKAAPQSAYTQLFSTNAASIWNKDRSASGNQLSVTWSGPFVQPANASTQSSALDALVAAI